METESGLKHQLITQEMFRSIFEESPIGIELFNEAGSLVDLNKACADIFGIVDVGELKGGFQLFEDPNITAELRERLLRGETARYEIPFDFEKVKALGLYRTTKAGTIYLDVLITPLGMKEKTAAGGYLLHIQDITERKKTEDELNESYSHLENLVKARTLELATLNEKLKNEIEGHKKDKEELQFRNIILSTQQEVSQDGILVVDAERKIIFLNQRFVEMWNITAEVMESGSAERALQAVLDMPVDPEEFVSRINYLYEHHNEKSQTEIPLKDGRTFERYSAPMFGPNGKYLGRVWFYRDITRRRMADEALRQSQERSRAQYKAIPIPTYTWQRKGDSFVLSDFNDAAKEITEGKISGWIGSTINEMYDSMPEVIDSVFRCFREKTIIRKEGFFRLRSVGKSLCFIVTYAYVPPDLVMVHTEDITERKLAEEALSRSEKNLRDITSNLEVGIYVLDRQGMITFMNPMTERLMGWTLAELNERGPHDVVHYLKADGTPLPRSECRMQGVMKTGKVYVSEDEVFVRKDGTIFPISVISSPIIENKEIVASVTAFRDITEQKKLEEELLRAQKLESVGTLAGGIAHDFNNLLAAIMGNISLAKIFLGKGSVAKVPPLLDSAEEASEAAKELSVRLLTFSKGGAPLRKICAIEDIFRKAAKLSLSGSNISCNISSPPDLCPVEVDEGQMTQVFNNIIINAKEAMPEGGTINISATNVSVSEGSSVFVRAGEYVRVSIQDTGTGISEEHITKIFDPYYTTKGMGSRKGTGLGLSVCQAIIRKHGGHISVESQKGLGSTFHIFIPALAGNRDLHGAGNVWQNIPRKKVLLMDDDERIRALVGNMLECLGYAYESAANGEKAVALYKQAKDSGKAFDAVILDLTVQGGMGGEKAIKGLLEIDSGVRAAISSGYADDPVMKDYERYGFVDAIAKPYTLEQLKELLDRLSVPDRRI